MLARLRFIPYGTIGMGTGEFYLKTMDAVAKILCGVDVTDNPVINAQSLEITKSEDEVLWTEIGRHGNWSSQPAGSMVGFRILLKRQNVQSSEVHGSNQYIIISGHTSSFHLTQISLYNDIDEAAFLAGSVVSRGISWPDPATRFLSGMANTESSLFISVSPGSTSVSGQAQISAGAYSTYLVFAILERKLLANPVFQDNVYPLVYLNTAGQFIALSYKSYSRVIQTPKVITSLTYWGTAGVPTGVVHDGVFKFIGSEIIISDSAVGFGGSNLSKIGGLVKLLNPITQGYQGRLVSIGTDNYLFICSDAMAGLAIKV